MGLTGPRAGFWIRFGAGLVDGVVLVIVSRILRVAVGPALGFVVQLAVGFAYYGFFEGGPSGQTLGKKALGIRVMRLDHGGALGWQTALLRHLYSYVSGLAFLIGYLWMLWDPEKQTWHDKWTNTVVVPATAYPPPPDSFGKAPQS